MKFKQIIHRGRKIEILCINSKAKDKTHLHKFTLKPQNVQICLKMYRFSSMLKQTIKTYNVAKRKMEESLQLTVMNLKRNRKKQI